MSAPAGHAGFTAAEPLPSMRSNEEQLVDALCSADRTITAISHHSIREKFDGVWRGHTTEDERGTAVVNKVVTGWQRQSERLPVNLGNSHTEQLTQIR
jgi:hypothetical protein